MNYIQLDRRKKPERRSNSDRRDRGPNDRVCGHCEVNQPNSLGCGMALLVERSDTNRRRKDRRMSDFGLSEAEITFFVNAMRDGVTSVEADVEGPVNRAEA